MLASIVLLLGTASDYLFPVTFTLDDENVTVKGITNRSTMKWSEVKRLLIGDRDVVLTPLAKPSRLDEFRGVVVRFATDNEVGDRASVLAFIRAAKPELFGVENMNEPI